jgi:hypothetical protein
LAELAEIDIPYPNEELERRRQEQGDSSREKFWQTAGQS